ncbi:MAG: hypothetical protein QXH75_00770 [Sulfolobaceae archaeon]
MFLKNLDGNHTTVYDYINRVIIAVINSIIFYRIVFGFISIDYIYFIVAIVAVVSFFFYKPLSIVFLFAYLAQNSIVYKTIYTLSFYPLVNNTYSYQYIIELFIFLMILVLVPLILLLKFGSISSIITSTSLLLSNYYPYMLLFAPFGIAQKNDKTVVNILSIIPLLALPISLYYIYSYNLTLLISSSILIIAAGLLFGFKKLYSLSGSLLLVISLYLTKINFELIILIFLVSIVLNLIPNILQFISSNLSSKKEIIEQKNRISENIQNVLNNLNKIKDVIKNYDDDELTLIFNKYVNILNEMLNNLNGVNDMKTLTNIEIELNARKLEIERVLNDYIFDKITEYNEIVDVIKNYGIIMEKIEPLTEAIRLDDNGVIKINNVISKINKNIDILYKHTKNINHSLNELLGINIENTIKLIDKRKIIDYVKILLSTENINNCKVCVNSLSKILQMLNSLRLGSAIDQDLLKTIIKLNDEKPATFVIKAKEIAIKGIDSINTVLYKIKEEYNYVLKEIPSLDKYKEIDILNSLEEEIKDKTKPLCKRIEILLSSSQVIQDIVNITEHKNEIRDVINLVKDNYDVLMQKVLEEGCIKISDLGISLEFGKFIDIALQEKGSTLRVVNDSICYMK